MYRPRYEPLNSSLGGLMLMHFAGWRSPGILGVVADMSERDAAVETGGACAQCGLVRETFSRSNVFLARISCVLLPPLLLVELVLLHAATRSWSLAIILGGCCALGFVAVLRVSSTRRYQVIISPTQLAFTSHRGSGAFAFADVTAVVNSRSWKGGSRSIHVSTPFAVYGPGKAKQTGHGIRIYESDRKAASALANAHLGHELPPPRRPSDQP
jgi:hypothetical protein